MSKGQHAADDGSFPRSAGGAMLRGIGLIVVAIVLGVVLLNATDSPEPFQAEASAGDETPAVVPDDEGDEGTTTSTTVAAAQAHDPSEVQILVANGTGGQVRGAAGRIAETLKASNYILKTSTNTRTAAEASMVYFQPGYDEDAKRIAALLTPAPGVQAMPDPVPVADLAGANVLVVVAADLAAGR